MSLALPAHQWELEATQICGYFSKPSNRTLVLQKPVSSSLTNFRFTSFSAVLVRDATPVKGHSALFRSGHLTSLSHSFLSKTAPSNKPRNRDGRLRERNEQYDISPLPSFPSRFPCSSLIFSPSLCFFLLSISLSPPSHSLGCLLDPSPFFFPSLCSEY